MPKAAPTAKTSTPPNTMTGLAGWVEVFKAGSHTDSKGKPISFSQADLDQMIANHELGAAPAVIGHPKQTAPAYAWAAGYKREGDSLFAKFSDINPAFEEGVKSGAYRNRSVSVFPDKAHGWRIRHIGWLGAVPPAIDGLSPVEFAGADAESMEFAAPGYAMAWSLESIATLMRGLREQTIERDGIEAADKALPQWAIDTATEQAQIARRAFEEADGPALAFSQSRNPGGSMSFTQEQLDAAKEEARKEAQAQAANEFAAQGAALVKLRAERQAERIKAQIKEWVGEGRVLPAEQVGLAEFMVSIEDADSEFTFSASDGTEAKKTRAGFFADFMASRGALVNLGRRKDSRDDPGADLTDDPTVVANKAREFMAEQAAKGVIVELTDAIAKFSPKKA
jgi:hypothetical protein